MYNINKVTYALSELVRVTNCHQVKYNYDIISNSLIITCLITSNRYEIKLEYRYLILPADELKEIIIRKFKGLYLEEFFSKENEND